MNEIKIIFTGRRIDDSRESRMIGILLSLILFIYEALVFSQLWGWYISPSTGLDRIALWQAGGILLMISIATHRARELPEMTPNNEQGVDPRFYNLLSFFFLISLAWAIGWAMHFLYG